MSLEVAFSQQRCLLHRQLTKRSHKIPVQLVFGKEAKYKVRRELKGQSFTIENIAVQQHILIHTLHERTNMCLTHIQAKVGGRSALPIDYFRKVIVKIHLMDPIAWCK
jgi:hypothetical protein